jgi:homoserine O-acetyltransferase
MSMGTTHPIGDWVLRSGQVLPNVQVAYTCQGRLNPQGDNAILVTHGFTSAHTMIDPGHLVAEGSWASIVGPGQVLDTDRYFVVASNMLGSSFGTTGPGSTNPATSRPWGPDFPDIRLEDIVAVQHRLLSDLGVRHLRAVLGPSYGGFQSLQWALDHPDMVDAIGVIASDFQRPAGQTRQAQVDRLATSPQWHGGRYHDHGGMFESMVEMRFQTLINYGLDRLYSTRIPDPTEREATIMASCRLWASQFDPNSMVVLADAAEHFDVSTRVDNIRTRVLMVQCTTDRLFPANDHTEAQLARVPAPTRYVRLDSPYGHMASGVELPKWQAHIAWLLGD